MHTQLPGFLAPCVVQEFSAMLNFGHVPLTPCFLIERGRSREEQGRFDILLVSEFARTGRVPLECSFAAAFFERSGVEVWDTVTGHIGLCVLP